MGGGGLFGKFGQKFTVQPETCLCITDSLSHTTYVETNKRKISISFRLVTSLSNSNSDDMYFQILGLLFQLLFKFWNILHTNEFAHSLFQSRNQFLKTTNIMKTVCNMMLIAIRLIVIILKQFSGCLWILKTDCETIYEDSIGREDTGIRGVNNIIARDKTHGVLSADVWTCLVFVFGLFFLQSEGRLQQQISPQNRARVLPMSLNYKYMLPLIWILDMA